MGEIDVGIQSSSESPDSLKLPFRSPVATIRPHMSCHLELMLQTHRLHRFPAILLAHHPPLFLDILFTLSLGKPRYFDRSLIAVLSAIFGLYKGLDLASNFSTLEFQLATITRSNYTRKCLTSSSLAPSTLPDF
jgi:hypothetical protein